MSELLLFITGFGRPDLLWEQKRLLGKYLDEDFSLQVVDNTIEHPHGMEETCHELGITYIRCNSNKHEHPDALNLAAAIAGRSPQPYWGTIDHDVFPRGKSTLIDKIDQSGFYGIGQRHTPTQSRYLFPGFAFFKKEWLNGRVPNFQGIRGIDKRDDGDCGSMMAPLFTDEDWKGMHRGEHSYGFLTDEDGHGLQSYGYEVFDGSWIHFTNASRWKQIPDPEERDRLIFEKLAAL